MLFEYDTTIFFVEDIAKASQWYANILSVEVLYENSQYAFIEISGSKIGFHPEDEKSRSGSSQQTSYWRVDSMSAAITTFRENGAEIYRGPIKTSIDEFACILIDPFGNSFGLISEKQ